MKNGNGEDGRRSKISRRRFLQGTGGAVGGTILTLYGGPVFAKKPGRGGGPRQTPPNGYKFYRIITTGVSNNFTDIGAAVMISSAQPHVYFHATNSSNLDGAFQLPVNYDSSGIPSAGFNAFPVLAQGSSIPASLLLGVPFEQTPVRVDRVGTGDTNANANFATTVQSVPPIISTNPTVLAQPTLGDGQGVYFYNREQNQYQRIAFVGDPAPGGGVYGSVFGDVALGNDDSVTFTSCITQPSGQGSPQDALIHMPQANPELAYTLLQTGDLLPDSNAVITSLGLVDTASDGSFVVQVTAGRRDPGAETRDGTALVAGNVRHFRKRLRLIAASPHLLSRRKGRHRDITLGESYFGPRVSIGGTVGYVTHTTSHQHQLMINDRNRGGPDVLLFSGEQLPGSSDDNCVAAVTPPSPTDDGSLYAYTIMCESGDSQLWISNGDPSSDVMVLQSSDEIEDGSQITDILQGYHPTQLDNQGRIAFGAEFLKNKNNSPDDDDNIVASVVIGVPA